MNLELEMGQDKIRHLVLMRNLWRYRPSQIMTPHDFKFITFGPGMLVGNQNLPPPEYQRRAIELNADWDTVRKGHAKAAKPGYAAGTAGAAYQRVIKIRTGEFAKQGLKQTKDQQTGLLPVCEQSVRLIRPSFRTRPG
ncbi:hypothetical protein AB4Z10_10535 [Bosea sp. RAF48]|uniref:hypothetical protein n=1 Tax=Bosea sp. RAF48 TaxID=3237480 RepID=UPI003F8EE8DB